LSHTGKLLAVPTSKGTILIQDTRTSRLVSQWAPSEPVIALAFAPDERSAAVLQENRAIRYLDVRTGTVRALPAPVRPDRAVAFLPDGRSLVTGAEDHSLRIWSVRTAQPTRSLRGHTARLCGLALARDGRLLASASADGNVRLWELPSGRLRHSIRLPRRAPCCLALAPDGRALAVGDDEGRIRLWDVVTGKERGSWVGHGAPVRSLAFVQDGKGLLSTGSGTEPVRAWDVTSHALLRTWPGQRYDTVAAVSLDGRWAVFASTGPPTLRLWDVGACAERTPPGWRAVPPALALALSPDGKQVATGGQDENVHLWDVSTGKLLRRLQGREPVRALAYSPRGDLLASISADGTALVWDLTGRVPPRPEPAWEAEGASALCRDLGGTAAQSLRAFRKLTATVDAPAVKHLAALFPAPPVVPKWQKQLVRDLDSDDFDTREKADAKLARLGERAELALQQELATKPGLELRRRIERLLARLERPARPSEWQFLRAVWALEKIGTAEARKVLREVARGGAGPVVTRAAKEALGRLGKS
jgi:WD40 repeat protein